MTVTCEQCDVDFESNFALYNHKISSHGPVLGIVNSGANVPQMNKVGDDPERFKRYRSEHFDPNPSKYRKVYESDGGQGEKRDRQKDGADEDGDVAKRPRVSPRGVKRYRNYNTKAPSSKYRRFHYQGQKRFRTSSGDSDGYNQSKYRRIDARGEKRYYSSSDSEDDLPSSKYRKREARSIKCDLDSDSEDGQRPSPKISRRDRINPDLDKLKKMLAATRRQNTMLGKQNREFMAQIKELQDQIDEVQNGDDDFEMTNTINSVINDVNISEFNKIRQLMEKGNLPAILRSEKHVLALKKLCLGLSWGIVPITAPQRIVLSEHEKNLIKRLKDCTINEVRKQIRENKQAFTNLFKVINESVELVVNSYNRSR